MKWVNKKIANLASKMTNHEWCSFGKNLKCIRDWFEMNLSELGTGISAFNHQWNMSQDDKRYCSYG